MSPAWQIDLANFGAIPQIPDPYRYEEPDLSWLKPKKTSPRVERTPRSKMLMRDCAYCGDRYAPRQHNQVCCSSKCGDRLKKLRQKEAERQARPKPHCAVCGKEFDSRIGTKYCTRQCRDIACKQRKEERNAAVVQ